MKRHDTTKKKIDKDNYKDKDNDNENDNDNDKDIFKTHPKSNPRLLETCDLWDICSEWWEDKDKDKDKQS